MLFIRGGWMLHGHEQASSNPMTMKPMDICDIVSKYQIMSDILLKILQTKTICPFYNYQMGCKER